MAFYGDTRFLDPYVDAVIERLSGREMRGTLSGTLPPWRRMNPPVGQSRDRPYFQDTGPRKRPPYSKRPTNRKSDRQTATEINWPAAPTRTQTEEEEKERRERKYRQYPEGRWFIGPMLKDVVYKKYGRKRKRKSFYKRR